MNRYIAPVVILMILTGSCLGRKSSPELPGAAADSTDSLPPIRETEPLGDTTPGEYITDCVFDTSSYKFTSEALRRYDADIRFNWSRDDAEAQAIIGDRDTLWLHIGGCDHFSYSATLSTAVPFTDSAALTAKSLWLAQTFFDGGFDRKYATHISKGLFRRRETPDSPNRRSFDLIDQDTAITNQVYDGFSFENQGSGTRIVISGYIN